jgi:MFS family permease
VLPLISGSTPALYATMVILGGAVAGFYTLGLTLTGEASTTRNADMISLNTVFIMAYTTGMVIGPVAAGAGMDAWPPHGLMIVLTVLFASFIPGAYLIRRRLSESFV